MGFDILLGNPPWEHIELKEQEWFATRKEEIASAAGAKRKSLIAALATEDPPLYQAYSMSKRHVDGLRHFSRSSGRFPLCGRGRTNFYAVFSELFCDLLDPKGRSGCVVPTGIATDDTTKFFFQSIVEGHQLAALYDFENKSLFPGVHKSFKFCALTLSGSEAPIIEADFCFFAHHPDELNDKERRFTLSAKDITLVNPNTKTCPIFRTRRDAEITKSIYRRVPVLIDETREDGNPWGVSFRQGLFNMTSDSNLFHTREDLRADGWSLVGNIFERSGSRMLPLYEAKMIHHYDHQWATYEDEKKPRLFTEQEKRDPKSFILPRYWVAEEEVDTRLEKFGWKENWLIGWRDITNTTNERTIIASTLPRFGTGDTLLLAHPSIRGIEVLGLLAELCSFIKDYVARQKIGGTHLKYHVFRQLPALPPAAYQTPLGSRLLNRVREYASPTSNGIGEKLSGRLFRGHKSKTIEVSEINAIMFHLYGIKRDDVEYIMETFPIVKKKDVKEFGTYRTKQRILEIFDEMATAIEHCDAPSGSIDFREGNK